MIVMAQFINRPVARALELAVLFGGLPLLILGLKDRGLMIAVLWSAALLTGLYLYRRRESCPPAPVKSVLRPVILRFLCLAPVLGGAAWLLIPGDFLSFPQQAPERWLAVMLLYPLLSAWPQEIIYRAFLRARYAALYRTDAGYVWLSAALFGYMHVIFLNIPAVLLTALLGFILARDYARHGSLWLVCAEHAAYGCLIFTVGWGRFFYSGAAWHPG